MIKWIEHGVQIPLKDIKRKGIVQPRRGKTHKDEIKKTMEKIGQLEDIIVRSNGDGTFDLLHGWTRYQAAEDLGWKNIRSTTVVCNDYEAMLIGMIPNIQRWTVGDEGQGYVLSRQLIKRKLLNPDLTEEEIIRQMSKESGLPKSQLMRYWSTFKPISKKGGERIFREELKLPERERVYPSKLPNTANISEKVGVGPLKIEQIISGIKLPHRGLEALKRRINRLQEQGFFKGKDEKEIVRYIDQEVKHLKNDGVTLTAWVNRHINEEINTFCRKRQFDRDLFISELITIAWRFYQRCNKINLVRR